MRRVANAIAGPLLIVAASVWPARAFLSTVPVKGDIPYLWLPTYCFLGRSLRQGVMPLWDPHILGGTFFAADPQPMGYLYLLPMGLFTGLGCGAGIAAMILLQPVLGGLGLYAFLRQEGVSRPASTVGGLVLALTITGSVLLIALPIAAALAWTALALAAGSYLLNAVTWRSRVLRALLLAVVWGQILVAHFSLGGPMGTVALGALFLARAWRDRRGGLPPRRFVAIAALAAVAMIGINLATLVPRLSVVPRSNLADGYLGVDERAEELAGRDLGPLEPGPTAGPAWPLTLSTSAGAYASGLALSFVFAGWWSRRLRPFVAAFTFCAVVSYLLPLDALASSFSLSGDTSGLLQFYVHQPVRLGYHLVLAVAVLAALGFQAWFEAGSWGRRLLMLAPGAAVWALLPVVAGAEAGDLGLLWVALGAGAALLAVAVLRPAAASWARLAVVGVVALELVVSASTNLGGTDRDFDLPALAARPSGNLRTAAVLAGGDAIRVLEERGGARVSSVGDERLAGIGQNVARIFGIESLSGYSSVQLLRFWTFVRATQRDDVRYNHAYLLEPPAVLLDLLQVGWVMTAGPPPPYAAGPVAHEAGSDLYQVRGTTPRVSVIGRWEVVDDESEALARVLADGFDPSSEVVLEADPGLGPPAADGDATGAAEFRWLGPNSALVEVDAPVPSIVLVRNVYDRGWRAEVDGTSAPVLAADYVVQGIPVPAGRHTIRLVYRDPAVGAGLLGSGVALVLLTGAALALTMRTRTG